MKKFLTKLRRSAILLIEAQRVMIENIETGQPAQLRTRGEGCDDLVPEQCDRLYRWFLWLINSADDAADLTHDTFVALWQSLDRFDDRRPFKPWLFGIARNVWRKHYPGR